MNQYHRPVLLKEVLEYLDVGANCKYIDATVGGGGHTFEILRRGGRVLGIDRDPEAIEQIREKFRNSNFEIRNSGNLTLVNGNFNEIGKFAHLYDYSSVNGILFDLGVSSHQLETAKRGFSFQKEGPLDMRMDKGSKILAFDLVNNLDKRRLHEILETYGQEKLSWPITRAIVSARKIRPIETTKELAKIVQEVYRQEGIRSNLNPATKTFLALRIVVNSELLNLKETLPQTIDLLKRGGRLAVISFHSLEDGEVKRFFKQEERLKVITKKPICPGPDEILINPRARSARLRVAEKL